MRVPHVVAKILVELDRVKPIKKLQLALMNFEVLLAVAFEGARRGQTQCRCAFWPNNGSVTCVFLVFALALL